MFQWIGLKFVLSIQETIATYIHLISRSWLVTVKWQEVFFFFFYQNEELIFFLNQTRYITPSSFVII